MRTTISLPDELFSEAKALSGSQSFSDFAAGAVQARVQQLKRESLAEEMAAGYRAEAESPSLDAEWAAVEVDGF